MYRFKQFVYYLVSWFEKIDDEFLNYYLNNEEKRIFNKLLKTERQHSIRVAKKSLEVMDIFKIENFEEFEVVKMCLLHDVGKIHSKINLFLKPFIVLIRSNKRFRKLVFFLDKQRVYKYYKHSKYSFDMLKTLNFSFQILNSIRHHHSSRNVENDKYTKILKYCDGVS